MSIIIMSARILAPPEIVREILSNLDTIDLLSCRRVSKAWNEHSLHVLKKKKPAHHVKLGSTNIQSFVDFVTSTLTSESPAHQQHSGIAKPPFPWKFDLDVDVWDEGASGDAVMAKPGNDFDIFKSRVNALLNLFGPECVDKVTFVNSLFDPFEAKTLYGVEIPQLAELLVKLSAGLTEVNVIDYHSCDFGWPWSSRVRLPKLTSFRFELRSQEDWQWQQGEDVVDLLCFQNADNLVEFKASYDSGDNFNLYQRFNFSRLSSLDLHTISYAPALLEAIRRLSPTLPVLQKFGFGFDAAGISEAETQALIGVLESVATTLKSLTLHVNIEGRDHPDLQSIDLCLIPLPPLPHLENFCIDLRSTTIGERRGHDVTYMIDPVRYHFSPDTLPALKSVDLPLRTQFMEDEDDDEDDGQEETFPNVEQVTLRSFHAETDQRGRDSNEELMTIDRRYEIEKLQKIFPNMGSVTAVKDTLSTPDRVNQVLKEVLLGILESSRGASLQELVIRNGDDDLKSTNFLGKILTELSSPVSLTLRNMCKGNEEPKHSGSVDVDDDDGRVAFKVQQRDPRLRHFSGIQNVTKIRLEQFSNGENEERRLVRKISKSYEAKEPLTTSEQRQQLLKNRREIGLIVQYFPSLTQLQLSPFLFGQTKKSSCLEEMKELATRFPNLTIHLI